MRVRYTPRSRRDLEEIYHYIDLQVPEAANMVKSMIERRIELLSKFPFIAPETDEPGAYEMAIAQYSYKVYYRIEKKEMWIVHIRHARRRPWNRKN